MRLLFCLKITSVLLLTGGLGSCSLYAPMLPAAPQIRDKRQVEIHGTSFLNRRWEVGATYSPAKYVSVRAAGGIRTDRGDSTFVRNRQYELAAGGCYPLGRRWLVSGLAGFGQARSSRGYWEREPDLSYQERYYNDFRARYHRLFGELAVSYSDNGFTLGVAGRLSRVWFDELTYNGQPMQLRTMNRLEPMVFCQFSRPNGVVPWLRGQVAVSGSSPLPLRYEPSQSYAENQVLEGVPVITVGAIIVPHLFSKKLRQTAPEGE